jgi:RHS repeat-associated protein
LTVGAKNPYRYRGYRYDNESGLYYLQSRYYDPSIKRFISADTHDILLTSPYEFTDKNLFAYVDNNPIMRSDADGEYWFLIGAGVGLGVGFTASVMSQYFTTGTVNWNVAFVNGAAGAISGAIASTGIGLAASVGWNAVIGGATYAAEQAVKGEEIAIDGVINSTFAGGFGGAVGGKGMNAKALAGAWGNAQKQITREMRRASVKVATKRIAVHTATKVSIKSVVNVSLARFTGGVFTYTGIRLAIGD